MLDPKYLRDQILDTAVCLAKRGYVLEVETLQRLEAKRKALQVETQALQNQRNALAKQIGQKKSQRRSGD